MLDWIIHSDGGLLMRIGAGAMIFAMLAIVDLRKNGRSARRWREYSFLLACVAVALAYGIINDQLTVGLSWEYFYYGKQLDALLGPQTPPDDWPLRWAAAKVGMMATWSAGLIIGVALLFANNPRPNRPPLPFSRLYRLLPLMLMIPAIVACLMGIAGYFGYLNFFNSDFAMLIEHDLWRPRRFITVYSIHLGGYVGGLLATILAVILIRRSRSQMIRLDPAA